MSDDDCCTCQRETCCNGLRICSPEYDSCCIRSCGCTCSDDDCGPRCKGACCIIIFILAMLFFGGLKEGWFDPKNY